MNYPVKVKEFLHGDKVGESDLADDLAEEGYPAHITENLPRYLVHELELDIEIDSKGNTVITHVAGQKLATPIVNA